MKNIFSKEYLNAYYSNFKISNVPNINCKKEIVQSWIDELKSGKLVSLKEEEVKSRFILELFGEVLDFNYGNSRNWLLREEAKTKLDGTKPDAALGYFTKNKQNDDVRVVIEIKDANTNLDAKQKREGNKTPIDQAFEYAPKMGGTCKWIIVSNFKEIRFYAANDRTKFQVYFLENLIDNDNFKEFLFLFHKDRFIAKSRKSKTDRFYEIVSKSICQKTVSKHILDDIYNCLKRFEGLGFVDPNYICNLYPFNVLQEHVWHYNDGVLFTINKDIFILLNEIEFIENKIIISPKLEEDLTLFKVEDAKEKLDFAFRFLNKCRVYNITAIKDYKAVQAEKKGVIGFSYYHSFYFSEDQGITKYIYVDLNEDCDCLSCNFRSFDFQKMLTKLKTKLGNNEHYNSELAYGNYLTATNDYKTAYTVYKHLEKNKLIENKGIEYFITKSNTKNLHNLIKYNYSLDDKKEIIDNIKSIDIDKIIHDELEFEIDVEVRQYLINIKEHKLIHKVKEEVKEINSKIDKLKKLYDENGKQTGGSDLAQDLIEQYILLYLHINRNFLVEDVFKEYKSITKDVFVGLINNYLTPEVGVKSFSEFFILEVIIHINSDELQEILKQTKQINIDNDSLPNLIQRFVNYFKSFYNESSYSFGPSANELMEENILNEPFKRRVSDIFNNLFLILSKTEITKEQFSVLEKPIINFLNTENILYWYNLEKLCDFIKIKGYLFDDKNLITILEIAVKRDKSDNNKYERLIINSCLALNKFYPNTIISNQNFVKKALANCYSNNPNQVDFRDYIYLSKVVDEHCKKIIFQEIDEYLDRDFNDRLYEKLLWENIYDYKYNDYFDKYIETINRAKGYGVTIKNKKLDYSKLDFVFFNFALLLHNKNIILSEAQSKKLTNLSNYENWLLSPDNFDYGLFDIYWLISIFGKTAVLNKIKDISEIKELLMKELKTEFNQELSNIYVKYFI